MPRIYKKAPQRLKAVGEPFSVRIQNAADPQGTQRKRMIVCLCDCGQYTAVGLYEYQKGTIKSCGCNRGEQHKDSRTPIYIVWEEMKKRCTNPNRSGQHRYIGRGIQICKEWYNSYKAYKKWALANGYQEGLEIDRIDNDKGYDPDNCRFVTPRENCNNRSRTTFVTAFGETKPLTYWVDDQRCVVNKSTLESRIRRGWNPEEALQTPRGPYATTKPKKPTQKSLPHKSKRIQAKSRVAAKANPLANRPKK